MSGRYTHRDSPGGSMRRGQRTFWPYNKQDRRTCLNKHWNGVGRPTVKIIYGTPVNKHKKSKFWNAVPRRSHSNRTLLAAEFMQIGGLHGSNANDCHQACDFHSTRGVSNCCRSDVGMRQASELNLHWVLLHHHLIVSSRPRLWFWFFLTRFVWLLTGLLKRYWRLFVNFVSLLFGRKNSRLQLIRLQLMRWDISRRKNKIMVENCSRRVQHFTASCAYNWLLAIDSIILDSLLSTHAGRQGVDISFSVCLFVCTVTAEDKN